jgi:hypothetical protein
LPGTASATPSSAPSAEPSQGNGQPNPVAAVGSGNGGPNDGSGGRGAGSESTADVIGPGGIGVRSPASGDGAFLGLSIGPSLGIGQLWFVPAVVIGTPGLLVILWVVLQVTSGAIWLPAARRLRGESRVRARGIVRACR